MTETTQHKLDRLREDKTSHEASGEWAGDFGQEDYREWQSQAAAMLPAAMAIVEDIDKRLKAVEAVIASMPQWAGGWEPVKRIKDAADLAKPLQERQADARQKADRRPVAVR